MTGKYSGPAHSNCTTNLTQKQSIFIPFVILNFSNYECHLFFKKLIDEKNDKVNFYIIRKTNEEHISVTYGCVRFIDCIRFSSNSLDSIFKTLVDNSHETLKNLKEEIVGNDDIIKIVNETGEEDGTI